MRRIAVLFSMAAVLLVAGCGGSSPRPGADISISPLVCETSHLAVSLGTADGAAGSTYYPLHFVNKGNSACTMTGYPGVSFVAPGTGKQVGEPATRSRRATPTVTLAPKGEATATVQVAETGNFSAGTCGPTAVSGLRIYPPGNTAAAYVKLPDKQQACSKNLSSTGSNQLIIRPVKAGSAAT